MRPVMRAVSAVLAGAATYVLASLVGSGPLFIWPVALAVAVVLVPAGARERAAPVAAVVGAAAVLLLALAWLVADEAVVMGWLALSLTAAILGGACVAWWRAEHASRGVAIAGAAVAAAGLLLGLPYGFLLLGFR